MDAKSSINVSLEGLLGGNHLTGAEDSCYSSAGCCGGVDSASRGFVWRIRSLLSCFQLTANQSADCCCLFKSPNEQIPSLASQTSSHNNPFVAAAKTRRLRRLPHLPTYVSRLKKENKLRCKKRRKNTLNQFTRGV